MTTTTRRAPFSVRANYGGTSHDVGDYATIDEAQDALKNIAEGYAEEGDAVAITDGTMNAHVDQDGHTIARFMVTRRLGVADLPTRDGDPEEVVEARATLTEVLGSLSSACQRLDLDDYRGEAVSFLGALMAWAETPGLSAEDAVRAAYGMPDA